MEYIFLLYFGKWAFINMGVRVVDFASVSTIYLTREGEREREKGGRLI
jgi:hypothetical protein